MHNPTSTQPKQQLGAVKSTYLLSVEQLRIDTYISHPEPIGLLRGRGPAVSVLIVVTGLGRRCRGNTSSFPKLVTASLPTSELQKPRAAFRGRSFAYCLVKKYPLPNTSISAAERHSLHRHSFLPTQHPQALKGKKEQKTTHEETLFFFYTTHPDGLCLESGKAKSGGYWYLLIAKENTSCLTSSTSFPTCRHLLHSPGPTKQVLVTLLYHDSQKCKYFWGMYPPDSLNE